MQSKAANQPLTIETGQALANTGRWETRQELPVETEILIPDYLPAVFKIVKCLLEPVIMQNSVADRRWQCSGYLRCTVYYQSDEAGTRLYRTEQKYAFEKTIDLPEGNYPAPPACGANLNTATAALSASTALTSAALIP
jgi:hypothetical protein